MAMATVEHSTLSFSGRDRWRNCPVSVVLSKGEKDESGPAAEEGTIAHTVAEFYVRQAFNLPGALQGESPDKPPVMKLDRFERLAAPRLIEPSAAKLAADALVKEAAEWNEEMRKHGKAYVRYIQSLIPPGAVAFVSLETRVAARSIDARLFGTADCLIWFPEFKVLIVVDYKYGFGDVDVGTVENPNLQLISYDVAALDQCTLQAHGGTTIAIFQPRRPIGEAGQSLYLPADRIARERKKMADDVAAVDEAARLFDSGDYPVSKLVKPGDHCRYCKAAHKCPATKTAVQAALDVQAGLASVLDMTEDDLIALYASRNAVKALMEDITERIESLSKLGSAKLRVETKQGRRMWKNQKEAALTLLALGLDKCLVPGALSEVIDEIPEQFREALVGRARDSVSIKVVTESKPGEVAEAFRKFAQSA
jgi:hypothetical protein